MADEQNGVWRTVGGRRVFIKDGQSLSDAMRESGKFPSAKSGSTDSENDDKIRPTNIEAIEEELAILRQFGEKTGNEFMSVMTEDGKMLENAEGGQSHVNFTESMKRKINAAPENSIVVAHNHPQSTGLSDEDLYVLAHSSIKELHVVGHNGKTLSMSAGSGKRPSAEEIKVAGERLDKEVEKVLGAKIRSGEITPRQAGGLHYITKGDFFAKEFGWVYKKGDIND